MKTPSRMLVTDLDGTLTRTGGTIDPADIELLRSLENTDVLRVVATGRTLFSARNVMPKDFPIDYLVFSSGAGVIEWRTGELLLSQSMTAEELKCAVEVCVAENLDFMIHHRVPENHYFYYRHSGGENPDFERRRERQAKFAAPWHGKLDDLVASQLLVVSPRDHEVLHNRLQSALESLNVFRATSPLDGQSAWLEIFSRRVSKAIGSAFLAARYQLSPERIFGIGNDYNDFDLLRWAGEKCVVGNAPAELLAEFPSVAANDAGGFAEGVRAWIHKGTAYSCESSQK